MTKILALGFFDGFHRGHQLLLEAAKKNNCWGVLSFSAHPQAVLSRRPFELLFPGSDRDFLKDYFQIPELLELPFDMAMANKTPSEFIDFLDKKYMRDGGGLVVGENFCFGRGKQGDVRILLEFCAQKSWTLDVVPSFYEGGALVSSSLIKEELRRGNVEKAALYLGYPYMIQGQVVEGDKRGRELGFPTANISVRCDKIIPLRGVYAAAAQLDGKLHAVALNIGYNPTFSGTRALRLEAHIIGYSGNLYGSRLRLFILKRIRDELRFESIDALKAQLHQDIADARNFAVCPMPALARLSGVP